MPTKPRDWPTQAAEARDRSAEEAQVIENNATEALEMTNDAGLLKRIGRILKSAGTILRPGREDATAGVKSSEQNGSNDGRRIIFESNP